MTVLNQGSPVLHHPAAIITHSMYTTFSLRLPTRLWLW